MGDLIYYVYQVLVLAIVNIQFPKQICRCDDGDEGVKELVDLTFK